MLYDYHNAGFMESTDGQQKFVFLLEDGFLDLPTPTKRRDPAFPSFAASSCV